MLMIDFKLLTVKALQLGCISFGFVCNPEFMGLIANVLLLSQLIL